MSDDHPTIYMLAQFFKTELEPHYPAEEVRQFIAMTFEAVLDYSRIDMILKLDDKVSPEKARELESVVKRLKNHEPIQYVLGKVRFFGVPLRVNEHVLIPRPETEELVKWIFDEHIGKEIEIMDVCSGSGCISIALKSLMKGATVYGVDKSVKALNLASINATASKNAVDFFHFDVLEQESFGFMKFDVMVSNPPYVLETEKRLMAENVLNYEPHMALFVDGNDPLIFYRRIVDLAEGHLNKGGMLYFEINEAFGKEVKQLLVDRNYIDVELRKDLNGRDRMVRGVKS
jgi:release factor glutamine methyltransferase